jgi:tetratricopeptide (TPR) repeat protein
MKIEQEDKLKEYQFHYELSEKAFNTENHNEAIAQCLIMWQLIPEPKHEYEESYYVAKDLFRLYYMLSDLKEACIWGRELQLCDLERYDDGEREFFYGKVNYDLGNLEIAKEYLTTAQKKSKNRCFIGEDKKYKLLVSQ